MEHGHEHGHEEHSGNRTLFDNTTVALGTIYTLACLAILAVILIWG